MTLPDLIYCAGGNPRMMDLAIAEGWMPGARSDQWAHVKLEFVDINYKKPNWPRHVARVQQEQPKYAVVPDLSETLIDAEDVARAVKQAEEISQYCQIPLIVPKLPGHVEMIPAQFAVGYSIPTSYGGAQFPLWELEGRRVHLLGGSPKKQLETFRYLREIATVISADGNYAAKMARKYMEYWTGKTWVDWPGFGKDEYLHCFHASLKNIWAMWQQEDPDTNEEEVA